MKTEDLPSHVKIPVVFGRGFWALEETVLCAPRVGGI